MQKFIPIILKIIGVVCLIVGIIAAYYSPLEIFVFYLFSEGGPFYYSGFGMGSFWFAALVVQNIGYYMIAALFIPIGIGHLKLRRWALTLTQLYIWFWLGAGILLIGNGILLVPSLFRLGFNRNGLFFQLTILGLSSAILLVVLPILALLFYKSEKVKVVFEKHDPNRYWTDRYSLPLLALLLLFVIMIIVLHISIFFQGLFPVFRQIMFGRPSAYINAFCVLVLSILIYGTAQLRKWAWWSSLGFISLLAVSTIMSFSRYSFYDLILLMNLPAYEMELIDKMEFLHNYHLVGLLGVPLLMNLALIIYSKRYFSKDNHLYKGKAS